MSSSLRRKIQTFLAAEDGPTTVEYAILLALLVGMMISAILYVGNQAEGIQQDIVVGLDDALNSSN